MGEKLFFKKVFHHHKASFAQQNEPNLQNSSFAQQNEFHKKSKSKTDLLFCAVIQKN